MIRIKDNPDGCVNPSKRGERTCTECYWSQVKNHQWRGDQRCWNSGTCLVADMGKEQA